jgi:hypothetical protein
MRKPSQTISTTLPAHKKGGEMERWKERKCIAGTLQPGDMTKYEMVAVKMWDTIEVVVLNDEFFDKITFLENGNFYRSFRGKRTNPWTIKAAKEVMKKLIEEAQERG